MKHKVLYYWVRWNMYVVDFVSFASIKETFRPYSDSRPEQKALSFS